MCAEPARAACSTSSCRRRTRSTTTSRSSPRSRRPPRALRVPVLLEGYTPPRDPRLVHLSVTPDPGVIEVNIIRPRRLGRARRPHDAPLRGGAPLAPRRGEVHARRPPRRHRRRQSHRARRQRRRTTRRSCAGPISCAASSAYFHQHPSLSFLFSGMFIGPTSQAPRIDEARNDSRLRDRARVPRARRAARRHGDAPPPWLVDRLFRDLLVDVTGNTHRAEFCIDKLFSPDSADGAARPPRAARVRDAAARAHEPHAAAPPPRARRALLEDARTRPSASRAGAPSCTIASCCRSSSGRTSRTSSPSCATAGYPLEAAWFAPHFEFRFPKYGDFAARGIDIELRCALEPWHVMGEDGDRGRNGALRRLLARAPAGAASPAWRRSAIVITCNGRPLPLQPTGPRGRARRGRSLSAPGSRRAASIRTSACTRRSSSTSSTRG